MSSVASAVVSPDGRSAYAAASGKEVIAALERAVDDPDSPGRLDWVEGPHGCIVDEFTTPDMEGCDNSGRGLSMPGGTSTAWGMNVAVSPDGGSVYVAAGDSDAVTAFARSLQRPPACSDLPQTVRRNTPTQVRLGCTDPNGDSLTFTVLTAPVHGTLGPIDHAAQTVTYTPDPDFPRSGMTVRDSFIFRVSDGTYEDLYATEATQTIDVVAEPAPAGHEAAATAASAPTVKIFGRALRLSRRGKVRVGLRCRSADPSETCAGTLTLKTDRRRNRKSGKRVRRLTLGKAKYSIPAGKTRRVRVRIRKSGRRLLRRQERRRRWVWVKATATIEAPSAAATAKSRTILLKAPRVKKKAGTRKR